MNYNTNEEWKTIAGYNGFCSVSSLGRVYNNKRKRFLKPSAKKSNYSRVNLTKAGVMKTHYVHRLVGVAFIPNDLGLETINHKDENKENNHVDNLEWLSLKDNQNYGTRNKRISLNSNRTRVKGYSICETNTIQLDSIGQGKKYGFEPSTIWACCNGKIKVHAGYTWEII